MLRERITIAVPVALARTLKPRERFRSSNYRRKVALLCIRTSYRIACDIFNEMSLRKEKGNEIPLNTFIDDFYLDGQAVRSAKQRLAVSILKENGFDPNTLQYRGEWPDEWRCPEDIHITVTGKKHPVSGLIGEGEFKVPVPEPVEVFDEVIDGEAERENVKRAYSQPDTNEFIPVKRRRTTRYEIREEDIEWVCNGYVDWLNEQISHPSCKILHAWEIEKSSSQVVYIAIDAVYVVEQSATHVKGGKPEMKTQRTRISHWNISVEFDNCRYYITAHTRFEAFQQLYACLIANELMDRYFTFFADGETEIFEDVKKYFAHHRYTLILDWIHIVEKVFQRCSSALLKTRKGDPRTRKVSDEKFEKDTALSVLYARRICSILWVGNTAEAISYINNINPEDVRNSDKLKELSDYLTRKSDWIVCYAIRRRAGLRNSSNGSEGANNTTVALRQKDDDKSWREEGSTSSSNMSCLFLNHEEDMWFEKDEVTFIVPIAVREEAKSAQKKIEYRKQ